MPGYTSIINNLIPLLRDHEAHELFTSTLKLSPQSENYFDRSIRDELQIDHIKGWRSRLAVESLRGWKWPYWINAQLNPASLTSTGAPAQAVLHNSANRDAAPIPGIPSRYAGTMDARGMITPVGSHFSLETWVQIDEKTYFPSETFDRSDITYDYTPGGVTTIISLPQGKLTIHAAAQQVDDFKFIRLQSGFSPGASTSAKVISINFAIRPYNLTSVTSLKDLVYNTKGFWMSDNKIIAWLSAKPTRSWASDAGHGDAALFLESPPERSAVRCPAGMATAVSAYAFEPDATPHAEAIIPLEPAYPREFPFPELIVSTGKSRVNTLQTAPPQNYDGADPIATASLIQLKALSDTTAAEIQSQFAHRPAIFFPMVKALLITGEPALAASILGYCSLGIQKNGYLTMGRGSWAFQGQFLAALAEYCRVTGQAPGNSMMPYSRIKSAANWIMRKRFEISSAPTKPRGLLPPGATRNGVGTEYQLADNIWCIEGLEAAKELARLHQAGSDADTFHKDAMNYASQVNAAIHRELEYGISQQIPGRLHRSFDPSSAADILDITLAPSASELLKPQEWLAQLTERLYEPLPNQPGDLPHGLVLRYIDAHGVRPARRLLLQLARHLTAQVEGEYSDELNSLITPMQIWTECLLPRSRSGCGHMIHDPEAAAIYLILEHQQQKLKVATNNQQT